MRRPWKQGLGVDGWRLGLHLGNSPAHAFGSSSLGWAAIRLSRSRKMTEGSDDTSPDAIVQSVLNRLAIESKKHGGEPEVVELYRYANDTAFMESAACADGMSRTDHEQMVQNMARTLRGKGYQVSIRTVR